MNVGGRRKEMIKEKRNKFRKENDAGRTGLRKIILVNQMQKRNGQRREMEWKE